MFENVSRLLRNTHHCVHPDRSIPVRLLHVRIAVRINTAGSLPGLGPSKDGDHGPPIGIISFLPCSPTRKLINLVG